MPMVYDIVVFILACAGATQIACYGTILEPIRPKTGFFGELFRCSMCVGFHVGYIMFMLFWFSNIFLFQNFYIGLFVFGCLSSFTSYVLDKTFSDNGFLLNIANK